MDYIIPARLTAAISGPVASVILFSILCAICGSALAVMAESSSADASLQLEINSKDRKKSELRVRIYRAEPILNGSLCYWKQTLFSRKPKAVTRSGDAFIGEYRLIGKKPLTETIPLKAGVPYILDSSYVNRNRIVYQSVLLRPNPGEKYQLQYTSRRGENRGDLIEDFEYLTYRNGQWLEITKEDGIVFNYEWVDCEAILSNSSANSGTTNPAATNQVPVTP